jgi:hypothetical protein
MDPSGLLLVRGAIDVAFRVPRGMPIVAEGVDGDLVGHHGGWDLYRFERGNAFVTQGLQAVLDSACSGLTANRISHIGVSSATTAVTAGTTTLGSPNSIKAWGSQSRSGTTVSGSNSFTQADVASIGQVALLLGTGANQVASMVASTAGSSPYNKTFALSATEFTATITYRVTLAAA